MSNLSEQEAVNLVLEGAIRGQTGEIVAQEGYYNYDSAALIPFMDDGWSGIAIPASGGYGSTLDVYGSSSSPYFLSDPEHTYTYHSSGGVDYEIGGYSMSVEYSTAPDDPSDPDPSRWHDVIKCKTHVFDVNGNYIYTDISSFDTPETTDDKLYIDILAGFNDNNGSWFIQPVAGYFEHNGDDVRMNSRSFTGLLGGKFFTEACTIWGGDQEPIIDDGVTPTGESGGGGGMYSRPDETIEIPGLPSINIADLGVSSIYHVTPQQMAAFSAYLWTPGGFIEDIVKNQASPMENVISVSVIPSIGLNESGAEIIIGNTASGVQGYKLHTTFYSLDFGTLNVPEYYKNFADYRTELQIYLPFIGLRPINIDDCMNGQIKVVYHVDVFSGSCIAFIQTYTGRAWHVIASYNGSIACQIPLSGANYMGVFNGVLGAVGSAVSGNLVGAAGSLMNAKPEYQRSGNIGSFAGLMGIRYPYLIFTTPQLFTPKTFKDNCGYISNIQGTLSSFRGFLQIDTAKLDLNELPIMDEERDLLYAMMDEGIYV